MRWKGWYAQATWSPAELLEAVRANEVPWSCVQTGEAWGPDDDLACPEDCQPGRRCFEPSARLVQPRPGEGDA